MGVTDAIWAAIYYKVGLDLTAEQVAGLFNRERKWIFAVSKTRQFKLNKDFEKGLAGLGYELKLIKKTGGNKMKILLKRVGRTYEFAEIENTLKAMQTVVGGHIEIVPLKNGYLLVCDESGRLKERAINTSVVVFGGVKQIAGDFFVCCSEGDEFASIPPHVTLTELVDAIAPFAYFKKAGKEGAIS